MNLLGRGADEAPRAHFREATRDLATWALEGPHLFPPAKSVFSVLELR